MPSDRTAGFATFGAFLVSVSILAGSGVYAVRGVWPWRGRPAAPVTVRELFAQTADTLRPGETLSQLFARQGFASFSLSDSGDASLIDPRRLRAGLVFLFQRRPADSLPTRAVVRLGPEQRVALELASDGWRPVNLPVAWRAEPVTLTGTIESSLYDALDAPADDSLLPAPDRIRLAWDLADIFAWQVDFSRDLRRGDSFRVLAERLVSEEDEVRYGRVLAGELRVAGETYSAYRFTEPDGRTGFYDAAGHSLRRAFLLAPVAFRRISSGFNRSRLHPILGIVRRHEGTDYAADPGTPVMAAGDGVVSQRGRAGGYGNLVELRHANGIVTRYGHLSGFAPGIQVGRRVSQGDVIGYVGSTGLATGPHLHYEFRVNGVARNPRTADLGSGDPVPLADMRDFQRERARLGALLAWPEGSVPALAGAAAAPSADN